MPEERIFGHIFYLLRVWRSGMTTGFNVFFILFIDHRPVVWRNCFRIWFEFIIICWIAHISLLWVFYFISIPTGQWSDPLIFSKMNAFFICFIILAETQK